jgi:transposase
MGIKYDTSVYEDVATRLNAGQTVKSISQSIGLSLKTLYRIKKKLVKNDHDQFMAVPVKGGVPRQSINREKMMELISIMQANPKLTIKALVVIAVQKGIFESAETAPHQSTIYRCLRRAGLKWQAAKYEDSKASRGQIQYERCEFKRHLHQWLIDPTKVICTDETSFLVGAEQQRKAWGGKYKPPVLERNKQGGIKVTCYASIGYNLDQDGNPLAFIHMLCVPPQRSNKPLSRMFEEWEEETKEEKLELKQTFTADFINKLSVQGLKAELDKLNVKAPATAKESLKATLLRIGRSGSRVGEMRKMGKGRPEKGELQSHHPTAYSFSEYLNQSFGTYLNGDDLWSENATECKFSADVGIRGCPDIGRRDYIPNVSETTLLLDNAPFHSYTTKNEISPFHRFVQETLGLKGVLFPPPYTPIFNVCELFFSRLKHTVRRESPKTVEDLLVVIRRYVAELPASHIKNWYKKAGFQTGDEEKEIPEDPNGEYQDRCSIPKDATFDKLESIVCVDESGTVQREKRSRRKKWSIYRDDDEFEGDLQDISVIKRAGVPQKRQKVSYCQEPEDSSAKRWVGFGEEQEGLKHASYVHLYQNEDDMAEIERITAERQRGDSKQYKVKWKESDEQTWLDEKEIQGLGSLLTYWQERNKRVEKNKLILQQKELARKPAAPYKPNRTPHIGDMVAVYAPKGDSEALFYVARVLEITSKKYLVQWFTSKRIDGNWRAQILKKEKRPYSTHIWHESILDVLPDNAQSNKNKYKISSTQLTQIKKLVDAYRK